MAQLTITQVAQQAGVAASTARYYESIGLLPEPARVGGRRRYEPDVLQKLEIIRTAQQAGFTLTELRTLFDEVLGSSAPAARWHELVQRKQREVNRLLLNVTSMKMLLEDIMGCDDAALADCIYWTGQKYKNETAGLP
jgi:MerR family redox-sensitive transcriptional activator SoxR